MFVSVFPYCRSKSYFSLSWSLSTSTTWFMSIINMNMLSKRKKHVYVFFKPSLICFLRLQEILIKLFWFLYRNLSKDKKINSIRVKMFHFYPNCSLLQNLIELCKLMYLVFAWNFLRYAFYSRPTSDRCYNLHCDKA